MPRTEGAKKLPPPQLGGFALADPGAYDLSVTPDGDSVDIEYRTAAFKSLVARNHALVPLAKVNVGLKR